MLVIFLTTSCIERKQVNRDENASCCVLFSKNLDIIKISRQIFSYPYFVLPHHLHLILHFLGGLPFSKSGFLKGPSSKKKKKYIYKVKYNSIINREKIVAQNLK